MKERAYDRQKVIEYAMKWAFDRNPKYYNFDAVKIASHTFDSFDKTISEYQYKKIRFVHIESVRIW